MLLPLGLPDKGRAIKGLVVCNNWDLEPLDLLNGLALGCYIHFFVSYARKDLQTKVVQ